MIVCRAALPPRVKCLNTPEASACYFLAAATCLAITRECCPYYLLDQGLLTSNPTLHTTVTCLSAAVQFLLPAAILSFCTTRLVRALRESGRIQRRYWTVVRATVAREAVVRATASVVHTGGTSSPSPKGRRLTVILVAIVVCFLLPEKPTSRVFPSIARRVQLVTESVSCIHLPYLFSLHRQVCDN